MSDSETKTGEKKLVTIKNASDLQRLKLEKLMKNPDKPVVIPERPKSKALAAPPDFVRNVMGSSAGAGSGEFHVYRHLRRKEYARQKFIQEKSEKEKLDEEYHHKIEMNKQLAEEKTAKKRAKRLRKKKNAKLKAKKPKTITQNESSQSNSSSDEQDEQDGENSEQTQFKETDDDDDENKKGKSDNSEKNADEDQSKQEPIKNCADTHQKDSEET